MMSPEQHERLPKLFQEIIRHDTTKPTVQTPIVALCDVKAWRQRKQELMWAADKFIERQRKEGS